MQYKIKNLSQFVDSRKRGTVTLPDSILKDFKFVALPNDSKWALIELMLTASRVGNPLRLDDADPYLLREGYIEQVADERETASDKRASRYIPDSVRVEVYARDMGHCMRCSRTDGLEFDHIVPFSRGGGSTADNLQLLCKLHNRSKSNKHKGAF